MSIIIVSMASSVATCPQSAATRNRALQCEQMKSPVQTGAGNEVVNRRVLGRLSAFLSESVSGECRANTAMCLRYGDLSTIVIMDERLDRGTWSPSPSHR